MFILSIVHLLFIAPPLLYVGLMRSATPLWAFQVLLFAGLFIMLYHVSRFLQSGSYINIIHILIIAPVLIAIGWKARNTPRSLYEILLMITFALIGWHTLNLVRLTELHSETATSLAEL
jgi:hypothetical protein